MPGRRVTPQEEYDIDDHTWNLGFVEEPESITSLLRHRFKSKVGGRPAWMIPWPLPSKEQLASKVSGKPLSFLLQVYCPVEENDDAFHRMILLFVSTQVDEVSRPGGACAFRCQLPLENQFYSSRPSQDCYPPPIAESTEAAAEQDPWRALQAEARLAVGESPPEVEKGVHMFPEWALAIEEEQEPDEDDAATQARLQEYNERQRGVEAFEAGDLSEDVEAAISSVVSPEQQHFAEFAARVSWHPDQVLRYCFDEGAEPLWPSPTPILSAADIPPCQFCSGVRRFEFQVLPQLLNHLDINNESEDALDWGSIAVYSCAASCRGPHAYAEEFVWVQPP